ncbi:hypothetical protein, partial [uncultured Thiodictyon sp.]|uniref:hypothetical protein n=1 Tax=uncultured Thiodictyon sp. TaxID=1846217 RepID=UPI002600AA99
MTDTIQGGLAMDPTDDDDEPDDWGAIRTDPADPRFELGDLVDAPEHEFAATPPPATAAPAPPPAPLPAPVRART